MPLPSLCCFHSSKKVHALKMIAVNQHFKNGLGVVFKIPVQGAGKQVDPGVH